MKELFVYVSYILYLYVVFQLIPPADGASHPTSNLGRPGTGSVMKNKLLMMMIIYLYLFVFQNPIQTRSSTPLRKRRRVGSIFS